MHAVASGDLLVLTTDGVYGRLDPAALTDLLVTDTDPEAVVAAVEDAVLAAGPDDNWAIVVIDL